jgi:hypothetical protein
MIFKSEMKKLSSGARTRPVLTRAHIMLIVLAQSICVQPKPSLNAALDPAQACPAAWLLGMTGCETHARREVTAKAQRLLPLQKSSTANMDRAHARMYDAARAMEPTPSLMAAHDPAQACPAAWLLGMSIIFLMYIYIYLYSDIHRC